MLRVRESERESGERSCSTDRVVRAVTGFHAGETVGLVSPLAGPGSASQAATFLDRKNRKLGGHLTPPPPALQ